MKTKNIKEMIRKYRRLGIYILLGAGAICCVISLVLVLGSEQPAPDLLKPEIVARSAGGEDLMVESLDPVTGQDPLRAPDAPANEGQEVPQKEPVQAQLTDNPDNWQGYSVGEEVDGFVVRSTPPTEESGLYIQKPPEKTAETYVEETPPPPPRPLDRKVMQSIVGIVSNYNSDLSGTSPYDEDSNQNESYYEDFWQMHESLAVYLPKYSKEFFAILKDDQYFSYAQYLVDFLSSYYSGEGYDAKDFRGSAETREFLNEWIERVESLIGS